VTDVQIGEKLYASWLEEQGKRRFAFLVYQCTDWIKENTLLSPLPEIQQGLKRNCVCVCGYWCGCGCSCACGCGCGCGYGCGRVPVRISLLVRSIYVAGDLICSVVWYDISLSQEKTEGFVQNYLSLFGHIRFIYEQFYYFVSLQSHDQNAMRVSQNRQSVKMGTVYNKVLAQVLCIW
jgi:hypothetical protein